MNREQREAIKRMEGMKTAIRRDGYNRGVRAAIKKVKAMPAHADIKEAKVLFSVRSTLKELLKPRLDDPHIQIQGTQQYLKRRR